MVDSLNHSGMDLVPIKAPFHISLSRTHYLKVFQIEKIVNMLRSSLQNINRFTIDFIGSTIYFNDDNSRQFIGIDVADNCNQLSNLGKVIDGVLCKLGLQKYYKDPKYHFSVASCSPEYMDATNAVQAFKENIYNSHNHEILVDELIFLAGNREIKFDLNP